MLNFMSKVSEEALSPMVVTIIGDAGTAKTSLGALFPRPLIIRLEDGTKSLDNKGDVMQTNVIQTVPELIGILSDIHNAPQDQIPATLVFDSITKLNGMIEEMVVANDQGKGTSINTACGGYGAGHATVASQHRTIKDWCDAIKRDKGCHIVFIAHSRVERLDNPDEDEYNRYGIKINKLSLSVYVDDVDMVCQTRFKTAVMRKSETASKKAVGIGGVYLKCTPEPSNITKNRYAITTDIDFHQGVFPFASIIKTGRYSTETIDTTTGEIK